jgi:hypothetical protein
VSEYQSYEFVALDRPLTAAEMAELRSISTRAQITPTRFFNEYQWGDLKADPAELLARYFDVHVYFANWGSRRLMFRLPLHAVSLDDLRACVPGGPVTLTVTEHHVVLDLWSETEEPEEEWFEEGQLQASLTHCGPSCSAATAGPPTWPGCWQRRLASWTRTPRSHGFPTAWTPPRRHWRR